MSMWVTHDLWLHLQSSASSQLWTLLLQRSHESEGWKKSANCYDYPSSALSAVHKTFERSLKQWNSHYVHKLLDLCRKRSPFGSIALWLAYSSLLQDNGSAIKYWNRAACLGFQNQTAWSGFKTSTSYTVRNFSKFLPIIDSRHRKPVICSKQSFSNSAADLWSVMPSGSFQINGKTFGHHIYLVFSKGYLASRDRIKASTLSTNKSVYPASL